MRQTNKYGVSRPEHRTWNGRVYASKSEMEYAKWLGILVQSGNVAEVIEQPSISLGCPENKYRADFFVLYSTGEAVWIDIKGHQTSAFAKVKKLWAAYARLPLHIIKRKGTKWSTIEIIKPPSKTPTALTVTRPESASGHSPESGRM